MEVIFNNKGTMHQEIIIRDIQGDMGEDSRLQLLQQADGDVILTIYNPGKGILESIEFCTSNGGGRYPMIASKLRELITRLIPEGRK